VAFKIESVCPLLQVFDMPTSVRFYRDVLGFDLAQNSPLVKSPERRILPLGHAAARRRHADAQYRV
jgi:catechol 2,3-dioxygenase-like lactoylglutathione lyase family enzyme